MNGILKGFYFQKGKVKEDGSVVKDKYILSVTDKDHVAVAGEIFRNCSVCVDDNHVDVVDKLKNNANKYIGKHLIFDGAYLSGTYYVKDIFEVK